MKIRNIGGKIIGIGTETVLPDEVKVVPKAFERSPILAVYRELGVAEIITDPVIEHAAEPKMNNPVTEEEGPVVAPAAEPVVTAPVTEKEDLDDAAAAEALRQARLASLKGITDEALGSLAVELGINPAECKDQADVLKKVKAALK